MDASAEALRTIARALPQTGVVAWVGTTVSAPIQDIFAALAQVRDFIADPDNARDTRTATLLGSFLEGHISPRLSGVHTQKSI